MSTQGEIRDADSKAIRVLLVEDNPGDARLLQEMLSENRGVSFHLVWADRLSTGLERLAAGGIDVVLLDLSLPDSQALDTLASMQAQAPHLPIIVLTGLADEALAVKAVGEGAQDYLVKGQVDAYLVARAIRYAIQRKRAEEELRQYAKRLEILHEIDQAILAAESPEATCRLTLARIRQFIPCFRASIVEFDFKRQEAMVLAASTNAPTNVGTGARIPIQQFRVADELWDAKVRVVEDIAILPHLTPVQEALRAEGLCSWISVPLTSHRQLIGCLNLGADTPRAFTPGHVEVAREIADLIAIAIHRKRAEEEKRLLHEQLVQAQKMEAVGTLAGGIAHEFNNINGDIIAYTDLTLEMKKLPSAARRNLEVIRSSAVGGADLTKSLLTFSRKDVGDKEAVNPRDVVDQVLKVAKQQLAIEGIELTVEHSTGVHQVMANIHMLESVVMNLIMNAKHAMLKSAVKNLTIQTGMENGRVLIRVRDTGCGIPEENLSRVFEPFFTTKGALVGGEVYDGKACGTGLGLSVSHSIVQGHGGEITVESQVGSGATFTVYLPPASTGQGDRRKSERTLEGPPPYLMAGSNRALR